MTEVRWETPELVDTKIFDKARILRSGAETGTFTLIKEIESVTADGSNEFRFTDAAGSRTLFYQVRFFDSTKKVEFPDFALGFFPLNQRERRFVTYILGWLPDILKPDVSEFEISFSIQLALNAFNVTPPETRFTIDSFPKNYEQFLISGAQINLAMQKYLKLSIRDFNYSDMGLSLNIDRGTKISKAAEDIGRIYGQTLAMAKWNFTNQGVGLGTVPLPISLGGQISRSLLNVLDIFTALGR